MIQVSILGAISIAFFVFCTVATRRVVRLRRQEEKLGAAFARAQAARMRGIGVVTSLYG